MEKMFMHKETGSVDTKECWISSYMEEELEQRGLSAEEAFLEDEGVTLIEENFLDKDLSDINDSHVFFGIVGGYANSVASGIDYLSVLVATITHAAKNKEKIWQILDYDGNIVINGSMDYFGKLGFGME